MRPIRAVELMSGMFALDSNRKDRFEFPDRLHPEGTKRHIRFRVCASSDGRWP